MHKLAPEVERLWLLDFNADGLADIATSVKQQAVNSIVVNVGDTVAVNAALDSLELSGIDAVVNAAGLSFNGSLGLTAEQLKMMFAANVLSQFNIVSGLLNQPKSSLRYAIQLVSLSAIRARPGMAGYSASKFAALGLNQSLYKEYAAHHLKFTAICPAMVDTPQIDADTDLIAKVDMLEPETIADLIEFCLHLPEHVMLEQLSFNCRAQLAALKE